MSSEVFNELETFRHQLLQIMGLLSKLQDLMKEADLMQSIKNLEGFGKQSKNKDVITATKSALETLSALDKIDIKAQQTSLFEISKIIADLASQASGDQEIIGSTKMNIKQLIALADKLDHAGKHQEADLIDKFIKEAIGPEHWNELGVRPEDELLMEEDLNLPEHQPHLHDMEMKQKQSGPPEGVIPGAREKSSVLPQLLDKYLKEPSMSGREELMKAIDEYMKFSKEEDVVASTRSELNKKAEDEFIESKKQEEGPSRATKELMWFDESANNMEDKVTEAFDKAIEEAKNSVETAHSQGIHLYGPEMQEAIKSLFVLSKHLEHQKKLDHMNSASQNGEVFEKLAAIADQLDSIGAVDEANLVDAFIWKHAKTEKSDPYDSKKHHNLQVREPKREQERVDREGRKNHHVHTYQETGATSLSTRYCPEHIGVSLGRIGENTYQCPLDGQVYNWETGWTDYDGNEHPGGSVAAQTPDSTGYATPHRIFDSRENILNMVN